jgi:hypothetical protein
MILPRSCSSDPAFDNASHFKDGNRLHAFCTPDNIDIGNGRPAHAHAHRRRILQVSPVSLIQSITTYQSLYRWRNSRSEPAFGKSIASSTPASASAHRTQPPGCTSSPSSLPDRPPPFPARPPQPRAIRTRQTAQLTPGSCSRPRSCFSIPRSWLIMPPKPSSKLSFLPLSHSNYPHSLIAKVGRALLNTTLHLPPARA